MKTYKVHPPYEEGLALYVKARSVKEAACLYLLKNPIKKNLTVEYGFGAEELVQIDDVLKAYPALADLLEKGLQTEEEIQELEFLLSATNLSNSSSGGTSHAAVGFLKIGGLILVGLLGLIFSWSDFDWWYRITFSTLVIMLVALIYYSGEKRRKFRDAIIIRLKDDNHPPEKINDCKNRHV